MKTLLDIERENAVTRKEREANLKDLNTRLADAKATQSFLPTGITLDECEARRVVTREIHHIQKLIADEQKAISLLVDATDIEVEATLNAMMM